MEGKVKNIGIPGIEPPEKTCSDKACPFHGKISIRGRIFEGEVIKRSHNFATVEWTYLIHVPKYERFEKRRTRVKAHVPACMHISVGDKVKIGECRPLSKTIKFVVLQKV